jgi:hypothetical protein
MAAFGTKQPLQRNATVGDAAAHKSEISRQLVEQRFGLLQDRSVEAFGEPAVDWREEIKCFNALTLVAPETREADGGAELPEFGILLLRHLANCIAEPPALFRP